MKVLLINGSPNAAGCTYTGLCEVEKNLNKRGIETEIFHIGKQPIAGCIACLKCRETGKCVWDDVVNKAAAKLDDVDGIVVGSPVYYSSASGQVTAFLDRLFYSAGSKLAGKPGAAIVSCRRGGATAAFDQLNKYFTINNMPVVSSNYWNQIHGNTPEQAREDAEGMQTLRHLGENMAWLLECIEAGKAAKVKAPEYEDRIMTNFIR